jgi:outer membrane protein OmpA-like peptidoglycan-associated protein
MVRDNHTTGSPWGAAAGAAIGAGGVAALGGPKMYMGLAGLGGGAIGYYVTTLRYDSGGIMQAGGQVYSVGEYVGIEIPTDKLFEPNSAEFTPYASNVLDSAVTVLKRYPNNNILISGNTSGFDRPKRERTLSLQRARAVSSYLWKSGINDFKNPTNDMRKLAYIGYGNYFPIASNQTNNGIRANSRIQITSYPCNADLGVDKRKMTFMNVGGLKDAPVPAKSEPCGIGNTGCTSN